MGKFIRVIVNFLRKNFYLFILAGFVGFIAVKTSPMFMPFPHRDSGVFMYLGKQMLAGDVLYKDLAELKGPVIFFLNALALLIKSDSLWGIWFIDTVFIYFASVFSYKLLNNLFGKLPAMLATILWLQYYSLVQRPNFTENYYLPFQFIILFLFFQMEKSNSKKKYSFGIGLFAALGFMIRPNMIGPIFYMAFEYV